MTGLEIAAAGGIAYLISQRQSSSIKAQVLYLERLRGTHPTLLAFLDSWHSTGPFSLLAAPDGGLRNSAAKQLAFYAAGNTNARTLAETPHGRGAAIDLWPLGFDPRVRITRESPPELNYKWAFLEMGKRAVDFGLVWGGNWKTLYDLPHIEMPNWRSLPYPSRYT